MSRRRIHRRGTASVHERRTPCSPPLFVFNSPSADSSSFDQLVNAIAHAADDPELALPCAVVVAPEAHDVAFGADSCGQHPDLLQPQLQPFTCFLRCKRDTVRDQSRRVITNGRIHMYRAAIEALGKGVEKSLEYGIAFVKLVNAIPAFQRLRAPVEDGAD